MNAREKRWPTAIGLLLIIVLALFLEAILFGYLVDDSFISYRYAANFRAGHGLVFNPGERVEGYSNFLWVMIIAALMSTGLSPIVVSKILGVLFSIGSILILFVLSKKLSTRSGLFILTSVFLTATDIGFVRWSVAGLETQLATILLLAALFFFLRETETDTAVPVSSIMLGLFSLTRPEGPILFIAALAFKLWRGRKWAGSDTIWALTYLAIAVPQFVFRICYYGFPFPNSYYTKTLGGLKQVLVGITYANQFFSFNGGYLLLLLIFVPLFRKRSRLSFLYPFLIAYVFFVAYAGGDHMRDFRFFVPILPIIFLLAQEGFAELAALSERLKAWIVVVFVIGLAFSNLTTDYFETCVAWWGNFKGEFERLKAEVMTPEKSYDWAVAGMWLKENVASDKVVAVEDCGMIPYYSGLRTIDMFGLMDTHLAHMKGMLHQKFDADYVLDRKPDIIILMRYPHYIGKEPHWQSKVDRMLVASERFKEGYGLVHRIYCTTKWFLIFERKEDIEVR